MGFFMGLAGFSMAQLNTVEFGKNRVQYKKYKWRYYQTKNFNVYFSQNGLNLGKFTAQLAEKELPGIEDFVEYGLQRRVNVVVYNSFDELQQSNIGLGIDWQNTGGVTKLVNNKMVVYYNSDHADMKRQVREGIARVLTENLLFGDDLGEFAGNQALLDLPQWMVDGYVAYVGENWSSALDDQLKSALLSGKYRNFYQFAYDKPALAGHAFWRFIADNYKKENVTYLLYLSRIYKSTNSASLKVTKKKVKELLAEFMQKESDKYYADIRGRRNAPKGNVVNVDDIKNGVDYYRYNANPNPRNNSYAVVKFKKGLYRVLYEDYGEGSKTLLKAGVRSNLNEVNPNYPLMAWDPSGSKLLVIYTQEGKIKMFVYDLVKKLKVSKQELPSDFTQIQDAKYMLNNNTLLLSAVKNGHSDIFVYKISEQSYDQITDDPYDDLDATFVAFPNKTGIIYSSNRPSGVASVADTVLASNHNYNIFLVDNWNRSEYRQISMLTNLKHGNARYPMQYNTNHFTFVSDENGIGNRFAGFFTTKRLGIDTLYVVGDEVLRNPEPTELDSALKAWQKTEPDSIGYMSITSDSAYSFPLTNYQSSLQETRIAGGNGQVTEVRQEGDLKFLYKLKVNDDALKRRNVNVKPTDYMKRLLSQERLARGETTQFKKAEPEKDTTKPAEDVFQNEFSNDKDSAANKQQQDVSQSPLAGAPPYQEPVLAKAKLYDYRLKFSSDYVVSGFNNTVLVTRWQPYGYGAGPIYLQNGSGLLNGIVRIGVSDLFEDIKFVGGYRLSTNLRDNDYLLHFQNLRGRIDWGLLYYHSSLNDYPIYDPNQDFIKSQLSNRLSSNLYQVNFAYPWDVTRSIRAQVGYRHDKVTIRTDANFPASLTYSDSVIRSMLFHLEYVYDNTTNKVLNILNGFRYKIYGDWITNIDNSKQEGKYTFNLGADFRYYYPIFRNFIWAGHAGADLSYGSQKIIYYLGGVDGWIDPKFNFGNTPAPDNRYAFQTLAVNLRGHKQNVANGNNAVVLNSEFRLPVMTTFFNKPVNNAFLRNFQVIQFFDLGTAWNGDYKGIQRPDVVYGTPPTQILIKTGGIGPFVGGYGFGARSTILGYFLRCDVGWPMNGFFKGKPLWYFALGLDF